MYKHQNTSSKSYSVPKHQETLSKANKLYITEKERFKTILSEEPQDITPALANDQLKFYGSYIDLKKEDKVNALENELVRDYHMRLNFIEQ